MREDWEAINKDWERCADVCSKLVQLLQECTDGPKTATVASLMLVITLSSACDIEEEELYEILGRLWQLYKDAEKEQTH